MQLAGCWVYRCDIDHGGTIDCIYLQHVYYKLVVLGIVEIKVLHLSTLYIYLLAMYYVCSTVHVFHIIVCFYLEHPLIV